VAAALAQGKAVESAAQLGGVPVVSVPVVLVTADNVKAVVLDNGFHTPQAIASCVK
jgi:hypothetical protein